MVQYAIIQHFDQKLQKTQNFYFVTIFKVKHQMNSLISIFFRRRLRVPTSMTQRIIRKIAIDDQKRVNFTESEKKTCKARNYTRLKKS